MTITVKALYIWLVLAVTITFMCGLVYLAVQQDLRQGANDPQIQMAEDTASELSAGATAESVVPKISVDLSKSLATFITVADEAGQTITSSARLDGVAPKLPSGVFDFVKAHGEDRVTWQPQPDVREATVITSYASGETKGFVVVGRSLKEIEQRETQVGQEALGVWVVTLVVSLVMLLVGAAALHRKETHHHTHHT